MMYTKHKLVDHLQMLSYFQAAKSILSTVFELEKSINTLNSYVP